jgi:hypothetical protein
MARSARGAAKKSSPPKSDPRGEEREAGPPPWCDRPPAKNRAMLYVSIGLLVVWFGWLIWLALKVIAA